MALHDLEGLKNLFLADYKKRSQLRLLLSFDEATMLTEGAGLLFVEIRTAIQAIRECVTESWKTSFLANVFKLVPEQVVSIPASLLLCVLYIACFKAQLGKRKQPICKLKRYSLVSQGPVAYDGPSEVSPGGLEATPQEMSPYVLCLAACCSGKVLKQ